MVPLDATERRQLLDLAERTVAATARHLPRPVLDPTILTPGLTAPAAAFVTLHEEGELRGCIGMLRYEMPLWVNVRDSAAAAARDDPRFLPIEPAEVACLELEISVLEPPRRIPDATQFVAGRHGIIVERGVCRALLLPQVATEMGWTEAQMLEAVCRKAGLPGDAWKDQRTHLSVFESSCFCDSE